MNKFKNLVLTSFVVCFTAIACGKSDASSTQPAGDSSISSDFMHTFTSADGSTITISKGMPYSLNIKRADGAYFTSDIFNLTFSSLPNNQEEALGTMRVGAYTGTFDAIYDKTNNILIIKREDFVDIPAGTVFNIVK